MKSILTALEESVRLGIPVVCATVVSSKGSVPRKPGAKMLVFADARTLGTVGGGKFEALVVEHALGALSERVPVLKTYPLHEHAKDSFGAVCGGECEVLLEPFSAGATLVVVGAGHCAKALAMFATECGFRVTVVDDRQTLLDALPAGVHAVRGDAGETVRKTTWTVRDALVLVSRNFELDREALDAGLDFPGIGYIGMIGSRKKVAQVFKELQERGRCQADFSRVHAPLGLDIGAESPAEIAVSILAEALMVLRGKAGGSKGSSPD